MKIMRLEKIYAGGLAIIFGLIVLHAPLSVGLGVLFPKYDLLIKSWKEIVMLFLIPVALIIIKRRHLMKELLSDSLFFVVIGYVFIYLVISLVLFQGLQETAAGLAIDLRYVLFFCLVYILLITMPAYRQLMIKIGIIGAAVIVGFATLQLFLPADILSHIGYGKDTIEPYLTVDKNPNYIRVNSTLRGPNPLGAYAGMVLTLIAAAWARGRLQIRRNKYGAAILALCSMVALWISYSRSSLVAGILAVIFVFLIGSGRRFSKKVWVTALVATIVVFGTIITMHSGSLISNVLFHENPSGGSSIDSNQQHVQSLASGMTMLLHDPFGSGVGSTGSASLQGKNPLIIENQYLFVAHEVGWMGIILFLALFIGILIRLWRQREEWLSLGVFASGVGLGLIGILLPVWVDDTVSIIWWGLAAVALAGGHHARTTSK